LRVFNVFRRTRQSFELANRGKRGNSAGSTPCVNFLMALPPSSAVPSPSSYARCKRFEKGTQSLVPSLLDNSIDAQKAYLPLSPKKCIYIHGYHRIDRDICILKREAHKPRKNRTRNSFLSIFGCAWKHLSLCSRSTGISSWSSSVSRIASPMGVGNSPQSCRSEPVS